MKKKPNEYITYEGHFIDIITIPIQRLGFWVRRNVSLEKVVAILISVIGLFVSIASLYVSNVAKNMSLETQRIADLEKQPSFIVDKEIKGETEKYIIRNTGGEIQYGHVSGKKMFDISIYSNNYYYVGQLYLVLNNSMTMGYSQYNFETSSFELYTDSSYSTLFSGFNKIKSIINEAGFDCSIIIVDYFEFTYRDYKQEEIRKAMIAQDEAIINIDGINKTNFKVLYGDLNDLEDERVIKDIQEMLETFTQ